MAWQVKPLVRQLGIRSAGPKSREEWRAALKGVVSSVLRQEETMQNAVDTLSHKNIALSLKY